MTDKDNNLQIRIATPEIPEEESDQALFGLFDLLLNEKTVAEQDNQENVDYQQKKSKTI
jgi:hypothetical protein